MCKNVLTIDSDFINDSVLLNKTASTTRLYASHVVSSSLMSMLTIMEVTIRHWRNVSNRNLCLRRIFSHSTTVLEINSSGVIPSICRLLYTRYTSLSVLVLTGPVKPTARSSSTSQPRCTGFKRRWTLKWELVLRRFDASAVPKTLVKMHRNVLFNKRRLVCVTISYTGNCQYDFMADFD